MAQHAARGKSTLTLTVELEGVRDTLRALRALPKEASDQLRVETLALSTRLAEKVQAAARAQGGQARAVAVTVKARRDRVPVIVAGGAKRVGRKRSPAYGLLFGSEFGMNGRSGWYAASRYRASRGRQYRPHHGRHSYWFFKTVEANESEIAAAWRRVADDVVAKFSEGG